MTIPFSSVLPGCIVGFGKNSDPIISTDRTYTIILSNGQLGFSSNEGTFVPLNDALWSFLGGYVSVTTTSMDTTLLDWASSSRVSVSNTPTSFTVTVGNKSASATTFREALYAASIL